MTYPGLTREWHNVNMYIQTRRDPVEVTPPTPPQGRGPAQRGVSPSGCNHRISRHASSQRSSSCCGQQQQPPAGRSGGGAASPRSSRLLEVAAVRRRRQASAVLRPPPPGSATARYRPSLKGTRQCEAQRCTHTFLIFFISLLLSD
jgi:hypothetical protein